MPQLIKKYKFITILENNANLFVNDHPSFQILNNKRMNLLGMIEYYAEWNQYIFESAPNMVYSVSCLRDIIDFINNQIPRKVN
jgi:hypothetical protein